METEKQCAAAEDRFPENSHTTDQLILVVDGGRTNLRLILVNQHGEILARSQGQGLPLTLKVIEEWVELLLSSTSTLISSLGKTLTDISVASAGLAGLGRREDCDLLAGALIKAGSPFPWLIESDAQMTLRAAAECGPVILCLLGTGSVFFARDPEGNVDRVGGWGAFFEDAGSGFEIARRALLRIFLIEDGVEDDAAFRDQFFHEADIASVQTLRGELYRNSAEFSLWAGYAPFVLSLAEKGNTSAQQIVKEQVEKVIHSLKVLIQKGNLPSGTAIVFAGGLVQGSAFYLDLYRSSLGIALTAHPVRLLDKEPFWGGWSHARTWLQTHLPRGSTPK